MVPSEADVVVIGGGIAGCATAYELAKRNASVVLLEKGEIGAEQSNRAWGFVRQQGRDPAELPLMIAANKMWPTLSQELEADIEWVQGGVLTVAEDAERMDLFREWFAVAKQRDLDTRILTSQEVAELIPEMRGTWAGGMYTPSDGHAEPLKVTPAFARAAETHGAKIYTHCAAEGIELTYGQVSAVRSTQGVIKTPVVVCAAGAWSSHIARMVSLALPQLVVRATVAETVPVSPVTNVATWTPDVSFRQRTNGSFYIARAEDSDYDLTLDSFRYARSFLPNYLKNWRAFRLHFGVDLARDILRELPGAPAKQHPFAHLNRAEPTPNPAIVARSRQHFIRLFPQLENIQVQRTWAGLIDTTPDALPVLGEALPPKGFLFATGFSGHGFAMGPIVGRLMSELILDGQPSVDISALSYARFREGRVGKPKSIV